MKPFYNYERIIFDYLEGKQQKGDNNSIEKHLWTKKATGLGITEFMLRYMA